MLISVETPFSCSSREQLPENGVSLLHILPPSFSHFHLSPLSLMPGCPPSLLNKSTSSFTHYQAGVRGAGFDAIARRFCVQGGGETIRYWHSKWNGTPHSLEDKKRSGRPRRLSSREVQQHVRAPILRANRSHRAVHYTSLLTAVKEKTGKQIALRTLQDYGKKELGIKKRRGKKRTAEECECTHMRKKECG